VSRGEQLAAAVEAAAAARGVGLAITRVDCLDGCRTPGNAALRARGRAFLRFSALTDADAGALVTAALAYDDRVAEPVPPSLEARTMRIGPRGSAKIA
jgi:predicted metal-binding protein